MNKIEIFFNNIKTKISKIDIKTNVKPSGVADLLTILALIIIFITTSLLNPYVGMYILAIELLIFSYFISKGGEN